MTRLVRTAGTVSPAMLEELDFERGFFILQNCMPYLRAIEQCEPFLRLELYRFHFRPV